MKKIFQSGIALLLFVAFSACSSDDNNDNNNPDIPSSGTITAKINGENWTGDIGSVTLIRYGTQNQQRFDINASDGSQRLMLAAESAIGSNAGMPLATYTYDLDGLFLHDYAIGGNHYMEHFPTGGSMTITSMNATTKKVSGTFNFTSEKVGTLQNQIVTPENVAITEGQFTNLTYMVIEQ